MKTAFVSSSRWLPLTPSSGFARCAAGTRTLKKRASLPLSVAIPLIRTSPDLPVLVRRRGLRPDNGVRQLRG